MISIEFTGRRLSIAADCAEAQVLGTDVAIAIEAIDEAHTRVNVPNWLERFRRPRQFWAAGLVGVQSNQYPRALDIARPFRPPASRSQSADFTCPACVSMLDGSASGSMHAGHGRFDVCR